MMKCLVKNCSNEYATSEGVFINYYINGKGNNIKKWICDKCYLFLIKNEDNSSTLCLNGYNKWKQIKKK